MNWRGRGADGAVCELNLSPSIVHPSHAYPIIGNTISASTANYMTVIYMKQS